MVNAFFSCSVLNPHLLRAIGGLHLSESQRTATVTDRGKARAVRESSSASLKAWVERGLFSASLDPLGLWRERDYCMSWHGVFSTLILSPDLDID